MNLRVRIYVILSVLLMITLMGGGVTVWYTYQIDEWLTEIIDEDVAAFQAAEALEIALINQKGFVSYYFLDGNPEWLRRLGEYRQVFADQLTKTRSLVRTPQQTEAIRQIEVEYLLYITGKDRVIAHYKAGERDAGKKLHQDVREHFFRVFELCGIYKKIHTKRILRAREKSRTQARQLRIIAGSAVLLTFLLTLFLALVLVNHILGTVRKLALEADKADHPPQPEDEIKALSRSVRGLIRNADQTHIELKRSREHLLQSEKMAMVGKLAAGTAHSIRNPLTSVKMRLFSLNRSLVSDTQKEDFEVISDEIRHIDTIVQNFLEFSRPPKLKMQEISPSLVVDMAIRLLEHRLKSYEVRVRIEREKPLPDIQADPEQLKEMLVNLVVNACEAMERGGEITIHEEMVFMRPSHHLAVIRLSDTGPGISESVQEKVFEPFFTTKDEGTGLGLSIASRIIEEHGGWLDVASPEGEGATFVLTFPVEEAEI